jgi:hypothetical protein
MYENKIMKHIFLMLHVFINGSDRAKMLLSITGVVLLPVSGNT